MALTAFPVARLAFILCRQVSRPVAKYAKGKAKRSRWFREYICIPPARLYNRMEMKIKMRMENLGRPTNVPHLNDAMAIKIGANLIGEMVIFFIAVSFLTFDYLRKKRKEQKLLSTQQAAFDRINGKISDLIDATENQDVLLGHLADDVDALNSQVSEVIRKLKNPSALAHEQSEETTYPAPSEAPPEEKEGRKEGWSSAAKSFFRGFSRRAGLLLYAVDYIEREILNCR